jgi:hypothetical protein
MIAKGLSPGAALVFLLAAPATSIATIMLLANQFGRRFVVRYVAAVALGALAAGALFDWLIEPPVVRAFIVGTINPGAGPAWWEVSAAVLLLGLVATSVARGVGRRLAPRDAAHTAP